METVPRGTALARVVDLASSLTEGALIVRGEPGIGKTRLLEEAHESRAFRSVLVHINPGEDGYPLAGASALFAAIQDARAAEFSGRFALRWTTPEGLFGAAHDLLTVLRGLGIPPTTVLIDDIDRMDAESRTLIGIMAGRLSGTGLRIVATASRIAEDESLGGLPGLRLAPWSARECVELGSGRPETTARSTLWIVAGYSGGNPSVMRENVLALSPDELSGGEGLVLPPRAGSAGNAVAAEVLAGRDAEERDVMADVALSPLCHRGVFESSPLGPHGRSDVVTDLVAAGLLVEHGRYVSVRDPRVRSHLYWGRDARTRRERHLRLAAESAELDGRVAAWHESFAEPGGARGAELLRAAVAYVHDGEFGAAVEFAERALRAEPGDRQQLGLRVALVEGLLTRGRLTLAARYCASASPDATSDPLVVRLGLLRIATDLLARRHLEDGDVQALIDMHAPADPAGALSLLGLAVAYHAERWAPGSARTLLAQADGLARDERGASFVAALSTLLDALDGEPLAEVTEERARSLTEREPVRLLLLARSLGWLERHTEARRVFAVLLNQTVPYEPLWQELARYASIGNEIAAGDFHAARAAIEAWGSDSPWFPADSSARLLVRAWRAYSVDALEEAEALIEEGLDRAARELDRSITVRLLATRAAMRLQDGATEAAVHALDQAASAGERVRNPALLRLTGDVVEAHAATGRSASAHAAYTTLETWLGAHRSRWGALVLARSRAVLRGGEASLPLFRAVTEAFEPTDSPYERGRTLLALATRQDELGLVEEARGTRRAARSAFDSAGAFGWSRRADRGTGEHTAAIVPQVMIGLSDEEREIVRRVQQGFRNREIASALFLSIRTVELRLTHIYRTLGVGSRAQLIALMNGASPSDVTF